MKLFTSSKAGKISLTLGIILFFFFAFTSDTFAANRYWVGTAGANTNVTSSWSTASAGASGATVPGASDIAIFDGAGAFNTNATINATWSVAGISITAGYSAIITQGAGTTVTIGASNYSQAGGTWTATTGTFDDNGTFALSGGTFTPPTTANTYASNFTISGTGNYNIGATATTTFDTGVASLNANGVLGGIAVINKLSNAAGFTIAAGTTINLGSNAITTISTYNGNTSLTNNGTIITTGIWTLTTGGNVSVLTLLNNGVITHNGTGWVLGSGAGPVALNNTTSGSITYAGTTMSLTGSYTQSGPITAPSLATTTFTGGYGASTISASSTIGITVINRTGVTAVITIAAGTTINLGNSPTSGVSTSNGASTITNNGTILVGTGTWTIAPSSGGNILTFVNNGVVTASSLTSLTMTYGSYTNTGTTTLASGTTVTIPNNLTNSGTITGGSILTISGNFTQSGTLDLTGKTVTFNGTVSATVTKGGNGILGGKVIITKGAGNGITFTVATGTTIDLGNSPTTVLSAGYTGALINNGTILVGTGTWTINGFISDFSTFTNNGTITSLGSDWVMSNTHFTNSANATTTYIGNTLSTNGSFTQNGTLDLTGKTVTFNGAANATLTTATSTFNGSIVMSKTAANTLTLASNLTVQNFTLTTGTLANVAKTLTIHGDLMVTPIANTYFGGSSLAVVMASSSNQNITITAGTVTTPLTINKPAGKVTLQADYVSSGSGAAVTITAGTLYLNGKILSATTTVANGAELQIQGAEFFTTPTLSTGSTITYVGDSDSAADTYYINSAIPFYNLKINAPDSSLDTFIPSSGLISGLIGYWKFDDSGTTTVADYRVPGLNGTKVGYSAPAYGTSTPDIHITFTNPYSLNFTPNQYVNVPASTAFDTQRLTISAWVYAANFNQQGFIFEKGNVNTQYSFYFESNSSIKFRTVNSAGTMDDLAVTISTTNLTNGAWNHVVAVYDGSNKIIYVNGVAATPRAYTQILKTGLGTAERIGAYGGAAPSYYFNGKIDDLRVYTYALSSTEIASLYQKDNTSTSTLSISGNLTVSSGTFNASSTPLAFIGTNQTITLAGTTTIASLTAGSTTASTTLNFAPTGNLVITGTTTLQGTSTMPLTLRSTIEDEQWHFQPDGPRTLAYLDVKDSYNTSSTTIETTGMNVVDSDNNTNWTFGAAAVLTVGKSGSQIATTTATSTDQDLGGAFTLLSTGGALTVDSLKLKHTGSFPNADIEDIELYYKEEESCSAVKPDGATLFDTITALDENGQATSTGDTPISLTVDTKVCLYLVYDLSGTTGTSTLGRSIDFEITNPSTDIVVTGGTVSTTNKVNISGRTMIAVDNDAIIAATPTPAPATNPMCSDSVIYSLLSLEMRDEAKNPTLYYLQNCRVWKKEGSGNPRALTNPNLQVRDLIFTDLSNGYVRLEITMSNMDPGEESNFANVTKTLKTTAGVRVWDGN